MAGSHQRKRRVEDTVASQSPGQAEGRGFLGMNPVKLVFAMEYVLQGLANPFQGITYHSFFRHFHFHYGLSEAATQAMFSKAYLAWSFKPVIGFFMDAYGKTRTALILMLSAGAALYLFTPVVDRSALIFFWMMFGLSVLFACTDVAVDRATVVTGEEEAVSSGRPRATAVGLNQAICWAAIYGTSIVSAFWGGWVADNIPMVFLLPALALVPLLVLVPVLRMPGDRSVSIPVRESVSRFWEGLHSGPILWVILFFFLFHFQPAVGALWTKYLMTDLLFSQTQIGRAESVAYAGYFIGVLLFAWQGVKWQERLGLKKLFRLFILLSIGVNLTQYLMLDPWFSRGSNRISGWLPFLSPDLVRWAYYAAYQFMAAILVSLIRMSTFSLVGAVIPVAAAGSLFAGFMSVSNLAFSFSYASGAWLYAHGLDFAFFRFLQEALFGIPASGGGPMSMALLVLVGSLAYLLSFLAVHKLPERRETVRLKASQEDAQAQAPAYHRLGSRCLSRVNRTCLAAALLFWVGLFRLTDALSAFLMVFFVIVFLRKMFLDRQMAKLSCLQT